MNENGGPGGPPLSWEELNCADFEGGSVTSAVWPWALGRPLVGPTGHKQVSLSRREGRVSQTRQTFRCSNTCRRRRDKDRP